MAPWLVILARLRKPRLTRSRRRAGHHAQGFLHTPGFDLVQSKIYNLRFERDAR